MFSEKLDHVNVKIHFLNSLILLWEDMNDKLHQLEKWTVIFNTLKPRLV
jgi:hypothetical protein